MAAAAPENPDDVHDWSRFQGLLPHVNAEATELHQSREFDVRGLARGVIRYLYQSGDYTSALALTERFIEQWTADSGPDDENVLRAQRHLGNILRLMGRYAEAYKVTEEALARARSCSGRTIRRHCRCVRASGPTFGPTAASPPRATWTRKAGPCLSATTASRTAGRCGCCPAWPSTTAS